MANNSMTLTDNRNGKSYEFPILDGSIGPSVVDMSSLYKQTGMFSYDEGLTSTATCKSDITYIDGENGILMHRGYPIEWLADNKMFLDVVHLLLYKALPDKERFESFRYELKKRRVKHLKTVYSKELGSAAAPTAGLHFTEEMLEDLRNRGINTAFVTLHVGLGTFRPVKEDKVLEHKMHSEHYYLPKETADLINQTRANGGRVIAVGTTTCRTLESVATFYDEIAEHDGYTDIFIYPGYKFKAIDGLITNFHLPESTLIMLVSAFLGYDKTMNAYKTAVEEKYRFFSFGDAMIII